ncbi:MAG: DUF4832 domain-containing protein [Kiritimatiellota bacterium]|nr:DUF4832 domain-containing protein [Kiritimatiellota bacterium]
MKRDVDIIQKLPLWDGRRIISKIVNLEKFWDRGKVCRNPHKGWYLHYFDNGLEQYGVKGDFLEDFPGLNHIYLRLAWNFLEPAEKKYNWGIIDKVVDEWVGRGYGVAFRITCKETDKLQTFATPEWVKKAGAQGTFYPVEGGRAWEPDYGDAIFLEKLKNFHQVFAARYAGKPWLEYVDVGSYGEWGEGHTGGSSKKNWPVDVIKKHMDIYAVYRDAYVLLNDDFPGSFIGNVDAQEEILRYCVEKGFGFRDDSVCVSNSYGMSNLRNVEMFDLFWRSKPVDLEAGHYQFCKKFKTWKKGRPFKAAVEESHATFMGFHGYAREWLPENLRLAEQLANRAGYWYFLKSVEMNCLVDRNSEIPVKLIWENHGVAPAYYRYNLYLKLESETEGGCAFIHKLDESDNRSWMPNTIKGELYKVKTPESLKAGRHKVKVGLFEEKKGFRKTVELGFKDRIKDKDGFYHINTVLVRDRD